MADFLNEQFAINTSNEITLLCQRGSLSVYRCFDAERSVPVVVKRVNLNLEEKAQEKLERLEAEAALMMMMEHPNILSCYGTRHTEDGCFEILLEPGTCSLADLVRDPHRELSQQEILTYLAQVTAGLAALHAQGIVHRDIKCDNIIIVDGVAKIADFGEAVLLSHPHGEGELSKLRGTIGYLAPEIASGTGCCFASDIWSLGATLYEMSARRMPFSDLESASYIFQAGMKRLTPLATSVELYDYLIALCQAQEPESRIPAASLFALLVNGFR